VFRLTPLESGFLKALLQHSFVSKETLHGIAKHQRFTRMSMPNSTEDTDPKIVDVIICKLRKKLREYDPEFEIQTIRSKGYYFDPGVKQKLFDKVTDHECGASRN
jgi:DNA-binding response OmpR family regulator